IAPDGRHLYAVNEVGNFKGQRGGSISAFALDAKSGALTALNRQTSKGSGPCFITVDRQGKHALAANYGGGSACVVAIKPDGSLAYAINELDSTITAFDYDPERGVLTGRQTVSTLPKGGFKGNSTADIHVHPSGKFLYGSNRGHNSIAIFTIDPKTGGL